MAQCLTFDINEDILPQAIHKSDVIEDLSDDNESVSVACTDDVHNLLSTLTLEWIKILENEDDLLS